VRVTIPSSGKCYIAAGALGFIPKAIMIFGRNPYQSNADFVLFGAAGVGGGMLYQICNTTTSNKAGWSPSSGINTSTGEVVLATNWNGTMGDGSYNYVAWR
jgi:hypothetical protein